LGKGSQGRVRRGSKIRGKWGDYATVVDQL